MSSGLGFSVVGELIISNLLLYHLLRDIVAASVAGLDNLQYVQARTPWKRSLETKT